jgi:hypothetical protein
MPRKILYKCDPSKNLSCKKTICFERKGSCKGTSKIECAQLDNKGKPIVLYDSDNPTKI